MAGKYWKGQNDFSGGQVDERLKRRIDLPTYETGVLQSRNMILFPDGGCRRRPGTALVARVEEFAVGQPGPDPPPVPTVDTLYEMPNSPGIDPNDLTDTLSDPTHSQFFGNSVPKLQGSGYVPGDPVLGGDGITYNICEMNRTVIQNRDDIGYVQATLRRTGTPAEFGCNLQASYDDGVTWIGNDPAGAAFIIPANQQVQGTNTIVGWVYENVAGGQNPDRLRLVLFVTGDLPQLFPFISQFLTNPVQIPPTNGLPYPPVSSAPNSPQDPNVGRIFPPDPDLGPFNFNTWFSSDVLLAVAEYVIVEWNYAGASVNFSRIVVDGLRAQLITASSLRVPWIWLESANSAVGPWTQEVKITGQTPADFDTSIGPTPTTQYIDLNVQNKTHFRLVRYGADGGNVGSTRIGMNNLVINGNVI